SPIRSAAAAGPRRFSYATALGVTASSPRDPDHPRQSANVMIEILGSPSIYFIVHLIYGG
ncbi:hypothetical protein, partial [Telmatospirillum sp.]|uniref:hypothetical protein n=1 Tax=Telmatospirillum sp. TaxID=2079197 RepID=UPI00284FEBA1